MTRSLLFAFPAALCALALLATPARATILTFEIFDSTRYGHLDEDYPEGVPFFGGGSPLSGYGSRVTDTSGMHSNGETEFRYGESDEGFTPNVVVHYGPYSIFTGGPELWRYDYGGLDRVLYQGSRHDDHDPDNLIGYDYDFLDIVLVADPEYDVVLYGFDLGSWIEPRTISSVMIFDGVPFPFLTPGNFLTPPLTDIDIPGNAESEHYHVSFGDGGLQAPVIWIRIDASNLEKQFNPETGEYEDIARNIGIDNIRFGQVERETPHNQTLDPAVIDAAFQSAEVPEPASLALWLIGGGFAALSRVRNRKRRS